MVLEALKQIKNAEEQVEKIKKQVQVEVEKYKKQRVTELTKMKEVSSERIDRQLEVARKTNETILLEEKHYFSKEKQQQLKNYQQQFEQNKEKTMAYVMERMEKLYGSQ